MTAILGISAFEPRSAAVLLVDGVPVAAAEEERFTRVVDDSSFPSHAVRYCLEQAGIDGSALDYVAVYEKTFQRLDRLIESHLAVAPRGLRSFARTIPGWLQQKSTLRRQLRRHFGGSAKCVFTERHEAWSASGFFPSPFERAAILTMDATGEWTSTSTGTGVTNQISLLEELRFPHSTGLLYTALARFCGLRPQLDDHKLIDLATLGKPTHADAMLAQLVDMKPDGSFRIDPCCFREAVGVGLTTSRFSKLFGGDPRQPDEPLTQREYDLAASLQSVVEKILLHIATALRERTGSSNLCLAGRIAGNPAACARLVAEGPFDEVWIQPNPHSAGALGAALFVWHQLMGHDRELGDGRSPRLSLGPEFSNEQVRGFLDGKAAAYHQLSSDSEMQDEVAELLRAGKLVGVFAGRLTFGSEAPGSRCILADPRDAAHKTRLQQRVAFREEFRGFGCVALADKAAGFFGVPEARLASPQLSVPGDKVPAAAQGDGTTRVHLVERERDPVLHGILEAFEKRTGCPALLHSGLNFDWEPLAHTPEDAYRLYMSSDLDALCLGNALLRKPETALPAEVEGTWATPPAHLVDLLACPHCGGNPLQMTADQIACGGCDATFPVVDGIPQLFWPHDGFATSGDVTEKVKSFYEDSPFPNYNDHDSIQSLVEKAMRGEYAQALDRTIPYGANVIEVGCGTGQLTNFLCVGARNIVGADLCMNSLRLAEGFRRKENLPRARFVQMNLFRPCFRPRAFDLVLVKGVLMATSDPEGGLESVFELVKPGGHIIVGLYNRYGRFFTNVRRVIFKLTGGRGQWLDPHLRNNLSPEKRRAWYRDQYFHPREVQHSIGQVLGWFDRFGIEFVRGIPNVNAFEPDMTDNLFEQSDRGNTLDHFLVQARELCRRSQEGGFFLMIGRRPLESSNGGAP